MSEPLACSLHGFDRLAPRQGEPLVIIGAGPAGLINTGNTLRATRFALVCWQG
jgi:threonine dehydrogenase-like Zn-dependent dehydrogenase